MSNGCAPQSLHRTFVSASLFMALSSLLFAFSFVVLAAESKGVRIVDEAWLTACKNEGKLVDTGGYVLTPVATPTGQIFKPLLPCAAVIFQDSSVLLIALSL
eukprot:1897123-Rhodomonas_salina.3